MHYNTHEKTVQINQNKTKLLLSKILPFTMRSYYIKITKIIHWVILYKKRKRYTCTGGYYIKKHIRHKLSWLQIVRKLRWPTVSNPLTLTSASFEMDV